MSTKKEVITNVVKDAAAAVIAKLEELQEPRNFGVSPDHYRKPSLLTGKESDENAQIVDAPIIKNALNNDTLQKLGQTLKASAKVVSLNISHGLYSGASLIKFIETFQNTATEKLDCSFSNLSFTDKEGEAFIETLKKLRSLKHLHLANNNLDDNFVAVLASALPELKTIETLDLNNNPKIGDSGIQALAKAFLEHPSHSLCHLLVNNNQPVSFATVAILSQTLQRGLKTLRHCSINLTRLDEQTIKDFTQYLQANRERPEGTAWQQVMEDFAEARKTVPHDETEVGAKSGILKERKPSEVPPQAQLESANKMPPPLPPPSRRDTVKNKIPSSSSAALPPPRPRADTASKSSAISDPSQDDKPNFSPALPPLPRPRTGTASKSSSGSAISSVSQNDQPKQSPAKPPHYRMPSSQQGPRKISVPINSSTPTMNPSPGRLAETVSLQSLNPGLANSGLATTKRTGPTP